MADTRKVSRRQFVTSAMSVAAVASLPARQVFAGIGGAAGRLAGLPQAASALADNPQFKDQGVENLVKSPHARLRNIPVHAVTIQSGFWAQRREINVAKSIPSMHDLLEASGIL